MKLNLSSITQFAQFILKQTVVSGSKLIDATVGNGHDTLFLAKLAGETGHVYGFDIQKKALDTTLGKLKTHSLDKRVSLYHISHEHITNYINTTIAGAMFNLGYLPGADHTITTTPDATIAALDAVIALLNPGGVITIVAYPGHHGGMQETGEVRRYLKKLDEKYAKVSRYQMVNNTKQSPVAYIIQKK